jgi:hypothetical protein
LQTAGTNNLFLGIEQGAGSSNGQAAFSNFDNGSSIALPSGQAMSGLMGKGYSFIPNQRYLLFKGQQSSDPKKSRLIFIIALEVLRNFIMCKIVIR